MTSKAALQQSIKEPSKATLKKYGLSLSQWKKMLIFQGYNCPICWKVPKSGRFVIDHEHVPGWKKMPPEKRVRYVRGLTCWFCNRYFLARGMTQARAANIVDYFEDYFEWRRLGKTR